MDRRVFRSVLALFLVVTLLVGTSSAALAKGPDKGGSRLSSSFADWDRGHWANESLARMIVKGVLKGAAGSYGVNVQPNRPVTRLEAAIMLVRLMGLDRDEPQEIFPIPDPTSVDPEGQYQFRTREGWNIKIEYKDGKLEYEFEFEDDNDIPFWGRDAVAIALEKGFLVFEGRKMNPNTPLKRVEAAIMLVKAAGLEDEARAQAGAALPFKDAAAISYTAKGYVAVAIHEGLITGMPDGTFQPEKPVTRAQWAAMLDRFDRGRSDDANQVEGTITAVNLGTTGLPTISMTTPVFPNGVTYTVADEALFFVNGQEATISDLRVGDQVLVQLNASRQITMVTVEKQPGTSLSGTVVAFTAPTSTQNGTIILQSATGTGQAYAVAPDAAVRLGVVTGSFTDVGAGDRVTLTLVNGVVKVITVDVTTQTIQGTVTSKSTTSLTSTGSVLTVTTSTGAATTYQVADNVTVVSAAGASLAFADVKVGDVVDLQLQQGIIVRIKIVQSAVETVSGTLSAITIGSAATPTNIVLTTASGSRTFQVAANATVTYSGQSLAVADLRVGDKLTVTAQNNIVTAVVITQRTADALFVEGQVSNLNPTARTFTLTSTGGTYTVYWNTTTAFTLQGATSSASALANGQTVRAFGTISGTLIFASKVEIRTTQSTVSGTVSSVTDNGGTTPDVLVITSGSTTSMYQVASTVPITWNGVRIAFGDVAVGDTVTLTLTNNLVSGIQVTGRQTQAVDLTGQISNLDLTGKAFTLTVPGTSGSTAYSVRWNDQTAFTYQGTLVIAPSQLSNGQQVKVTGTAAGTLVSAAKVDVQVNQSSLTGTVTALVSPTTSATGAITVTSGGVTHSYQVRSTVRVTWQGMVIDFADLAVGDGVKLTLSNAEVTAIELTTRQMTAVSLTGRISNLDTAANTFTLTVQEINASGQTVSQVYTIGYTDQTVITYPGLSNVSEVSLANGQTVAATGLKVGQVMSVTRLDIQPAAQ